jgi:Acetyltransferase (GNAT) domain
MAITAVAFFRPATPMTTVTAGTARPTNGSTAGNGRTPVTDAESLIHASRPAPRRGARRHITRPSVARPSFLRRWIRQPQGAAFGVQGKQRLEGYGVLRACRRGFKIGPLFADDPHIAGTLFQGLASRVPGQPIFLDTPEANPAAIELAKRHGMEPVFETARMYTKGSPAGRIDRCFGVTTFELG